MAIRHRSRASALSIIASHPLLIMSADSDLSKSTATVAEYASTASTLSVSNDPAKQCGFEMDCRGAKGYLTGFSHQLATTNNAVPKANYQSVSSSGITQTHVCPRADFLRQLQQTVGTNKKLTNEKKQEIKEAIRDTKEALEKSDTNSL